MRLAEGRRTVRVCVGDCMNSTKAACLNYFAVSQRVQGFSHPVCIGGMCNSNDSVACSQECVRSCSRVARPLWRRGRFSTMPN
jgi:hypothetical protein